MAAYLGGGFGAGGGGDLLPNVPQKYARQAGGSFKKGLPRVPFDEFPAVLHEDEAVLPAGEAENYRKLKAAGQFPSQPVGMAMLGGQQSDSILPRARSYGGDNEMIDMSPDATPQGDRLSLPVSQQSSGMVDLRPDALRQTSGPGQAGNFAQRLLPPDDQQPFDAVSNRRGASSGLSALGTFGPDTATPALNADRSPAVVGGGFSNLGPRSGGTSQSPMGVQRFGADQAASPQGTLQTYRPNWSLDTTHPESQHVENIISNLNSDVVARMQSNDPMERHRARREALGPYADYVEPDLPDEPTLTDHSGEKRNWAENIWHHIKHGLKAGALGAAQGGLGGGFAGLVAGTASPKFADTMELNMVRRPRHDAQVERIEKQGLRRLGAVHDVEQMTGRTLGGGRTLAGQNADRQAAEFGFGVQKFGAEQKQRAAVHGLNQYKAFADNAPNGTPIPDYIADGAGFPRGSKVYHHTSQGPLVKTPDGSTYRVDENNNAQPVVDPSTGETLRQPVTERNEPQTPQYVFEGRAQSEIAREMGLKDLNQMIPNPAYEQEFQTLKAADAANAKEYGGSPASDDVIRARIKTPRQIRASDLISPSAVKARAAQIYEREKGSRSANPAPRSAGRNQVKMQADEKFYQEHYSRMSPDDKAIYENEFQKQHGRPPRKP